MISFFVCLAVLITGYFTYGRFVSDHFGPDDRETPAVSMEDGVDYVVMPAWRIFLIQLLNIAGLGPIWGAVGGALWGPAVFLWITLGTVFAGAVHDFASGFMSVRNRGLSVAEITGICMGGFMKTLMRIVSVVLLFIIGVVFAVGPAGLLSYLCGSGGGTGLFTNKTFWLAVVFIYYFIATFLPVDKVIGRIYPVFGICLIVMAVGVGAGIFIRGFRIPEIFPLTNMHPEGTPMWSGMFISVACGAISGFHSTQSPIMARCCRSERMSHRIFYGAMVCEGIIALVWAAASCALFPIDGGRMTGLAEAMAAGQSACVYNICSLTMGRIGVVLAMLGVIVCPVSSGDTAFRSARLTVADWLGIEQKTGRNRLLLTAPILILGVIVSRLDYSVIWNYCASINQMLATAVLWAASMFLVKNGRSPYITAVPATFMSAVTMTFAMSSPIYFGKVPFLANNAALLGIILAAAFLALFCVSAKKAKAELRALR